jgi:Fic-DOC domain mobile mystery protein B
VEVGDAGLTGAHADGATPLDDDEAEGLLLPSVGTRAELNAAEQQNIIIGSVWLDARRLHHDIDDALVWELHRRMFGDVWRWAGTPRRTLKNLGVPVEQIRPALRDLLTDIADQRSTPGHDARRLCATFHQRLVSIHVFPNGNGRHARLLADRLALQCGLSAPEWGVGDLVAAGDNRSRYIQSLRLADRGELEPLIAFMWPYHKD